ncbi:MAG TPA: DUF4138 domain-containing protein [Puia sp.]|jgi:hypothetical protein
MKLFFALLAGGILLHLTTDTCAQGGKFSLSAGPRTDQLFSTVIRSSAFMSSDSLSDVEKRAGKVGEEAMKICCEKVKNDKRRIWYVSTRNGRMIMQLMGIYTRETLLFFHLSLSNRSYLDYDMDSIRFFIADKGGKDVSPKRTELVPVYVYGNTQRIRGKSREPSVIALRRFTLPPGKRLLIEAREKNGGRHLQLQADNGPLVRARLI